MSDDMISLTDVGKTFGHTRLFGASTEFAAVTDVSLSVARGKTLGIVGESGSGKSTLLRIILGLIPPTSGSIVIDGQDIVNLRRRDEKAFRRKVQPIFQNPASSFNPRQSIGAILKAPLEVHGIGTRQSRRDRVSEMLERVGLPAEYAARHPHQLSGGQKQRVAIARAVILKPAVVLADEPTSALDVSVQAQVLDLFRETREAMGLTSIFVSHNLAVIRQVSDTVAVMRLGRIVEMGSVDAIFANPQHDYTRALIDAVPDPAAIMAQA
ncbi:ATP-binding cassette domain-containing protein [Sedimentitalea todarodis]|uniref:ATP-binding cassette domain-containing protein n=1 Tax=Sedimentitalea todarodis TaxID=1631240 RepID=A0ABU3VEF5_9RHOB|nr:ATP-binding cassette domain-containing protein [Sedimentitalea todarodis]MDU9004405.1 ATP-binding cassette domain-containing protein [Sedimentitalea todarodis]